MKVFDKVTSELLGGKAQSLVRLLSNGFDVPQGFVVFHDDVLGQTEIFKLFKRLDCEKVAVRSSGSLEDGVEHSFAGQFDTYLNVTEKDLVDKIQQCRDSVHNDRLAAYAAAHKINTSKITITVIVQKMVDARVAGVVFTINPVTNQTDEYVIEAVQGLGESLVSGYVTPDTYTTTPDGKTIEVSMSGDERLLTDAELSEIALQATKIQDLWGVPMDIEWAYEGQKLYILQARPVTTV